MTPEDAHIVARELMRLPGSDAVCVYDVTAGRALACRGDRGMRARQHARMASWALMTATAATARRAEPGEALELMIMREDRLHTLRLLDSGGTPRIVVHLVSTHRAADTGRIRSTLDVVSHRLRARRQLANVTAAPGVERIADADASSTGTGPASASVIVAEPLPWRSPNRTWPDGVPADFPRRPAGRPAPRWVPPSDRERELLDRVLTTLLAELRVH